VSRPPAGPWTQAARRLRRDRRARLGAGFLGLVAVACLAGPTLAGALAGLDATTPDLALGAAPPSGRHWLGTDPLGRDLLVRVLAGGRLALAVTVIATGLAVLLGTAWGALAAQAGGRVDFVMMRIVDILYGLPVVLLVITVMAVLDTRSVVALFLLIGAVHWMTLARIVRGQVASLRGGELVAAARALGASPARILVRHLLPNALGPIVVYAALLAPQVMLTEAFLGFLGLGAPPPQASWGTLIAEGADRMRLFPWLLLAPAAVMTATIVAFHLVGDAMRDALDPRTGYASTRRSTPVGSS
jgi:oligopeptide transport system permease protein